MGAFGSDTDNGKWIMPFVQDNYCSTCLILNTQISFLFLCAATKCFALPLVDHIIAIPRTRTALLIILLVNGQLVLIEYVM